MLCSGDRHSRAGGKAILARNHTRIRGDDFLDTKASASRTKNALLVTSLRVRMPAWYVLSAHRPRPSIGAWRSSTATLGRERAGAAGSRAVGSNAPARLSGPPKRPSARRDPYAPTLRPRQGRFLSRRQTASARARCRR